MSTQIDELLAQLAAARASLTEHKSKANAALEEFKASSDIYAYNSEQAAEFAGTTYVLESRIRELALESFALDQNKHPHEKIDIGLYTEAEVSDPAQAREWAFKNLPVALDLNETKVKNYAKDYGNVPGVIIKTEVPRVKIATKL